MSRPQSIVRFEQLYLGSLAFGLVAGIFNWSASLDMFQADPNIAMFGAGFLIGSMVIGIAISLLFWFFIARKRSKVAKWILIVFFGFGLISLPFSIFSVPLALMIPTIVNTILQGLAVFMLFRPDAIAWFNGETTDVGDIFD